MILLLIHTFTWARRCSWCVTVSVQTYGHLSAGDCRAVLCRSGSAVQLNTEHNADNEKERKRVEQVGGHFKLVNGAWRLGEAGIQVTRFVVSTYWQSMWQHGQQFVNHATMGLKHKNICSGLCLYQHQEHSCWQVAVMNVSTLCPCGSLTDHVGVGLVKWVLLPFQWHKCIHHWDFIDYCICCLNVALLIVEEILGHALKHCTVSGGKD